VEDTSVATVGNYTLSPSIAVSKAEATPDHRGVVLTLAQAPVVDTKYTLSISGVKDRSPAGNAMKNVSAECVASGPVYTLAAMTPEQRGSSQRDVANLPVKAGDSWTINMFVKMDKQPPNRTLIAGFGRCEDASGGQARYMAKFGSGIHFWSANREGPTQTAYDLNRWQMITTTYDGATIRTYKDGKKIGETAKVLSDDENTICLAPKDPWEHQRQFEGEIRSFTIWKAALGADAIASLLKNAPK
jgi:alpha-mannosidase